MSKSCLLCLFIAGEILLHFRSSLYSVIENSLYLPGKKVDCSKHMEFAKTNKQTTTTKKKKKKTEAFPKHLVTLRFHFFQVIFGENFHIFNFNCSGIISNSERKKMTLFASVLYSFGVLNSL